MIYDFCVIGGGIVGLATAMRFLEVHPDTSILLIEKEKDVAKHQTGHNSGVIHAGIYYDPGSLKAKMCREGLTATLAFCKAHGVRFEQCGKLVVATSSIEEARLNALYDRASVSGLKLKHIDRKSLETLEPNIRGTAALLSPETGIVDYRQLALKMAELISAKGGEIVFGKKVDRINEKSDLVEIGAGDSWWQARKLVVCAGLQADRLARLARLNVDFRIVPFRGEYFQLPPQKSGIIKHLIYPVPDPSLPFLGVHLTKMIDGSVTVGPNAVIGFAREGYPKFSINPSDVASYIVFSGFWKLIWRHRLYALNELKVSLWRPAYLAECQKYCPQLTTSDLLPYPAGIRAQVVKKNGVAVHDFLFGETDRMLHVFNAPSPAATSAIPIGRMIAEKCITGCVGMSVFGQDESAI